MNTEYVKKICLFACVDTLRPSQKDFSHVRKISCLPGLLKDTKQ